MPTILITRPQAASELLAEALAEQGFDGLIEPLLDIRSTDVPSPEVKDIQAVMITSANALTALDKGNYDFEGLLGMPCFCVGSRTAERAAQFGFRLTSFSTSDGQALAELIAKSLPKKDKPILHIAGRDIDSKAHNGLKEAGFTVSLWPIYDAVPATKLSAHIVTKLKDRKIDAVVLYSVRTAETFLKLLQHHNLTHICADMIAVSLSPQISDILARQIWKESLTAASPSEASMLECLVQSLPVASRLS